MDPNDAFSAAHPFRWDLGPPAHAAPAPPPPPPPQLLPHAPLVNAAPRELEDLVAGYGVRPSTVARISELGFTASTLLGMTERELDDMMAALAGLFRWDVLLGERFGLRAALRAERGRVMSLGGRFHTGSTLDAASQEVLSGERDAAASGGTVMAGKKKGKKGVGSRKGKKARRKKELRPLDVLGDENDGDEDGGGGSESTESSAGGSGGGERQREHPFVVTEPGEVARAKKNGLDYLFHLYEQCRVFLLQVQSIAKLGGHKSPTKVTNQVFRYAKKCGASYINKPKMRHYVHCYALHCLDEEASNALRRAYKARGENVGAWRQACYAPLVDIAGRHGFDIDAVFAAHPRLAIWYVPTRLRQLCHQARGSHAHAHAHAAAGFPPPPMF
uniref:Floricaula/leafy-like transcription factor n=1 Tax=Saccharum hybrid cultivar R570 TaxID=131158 RepID=A0A1L2JTD1_9POAL|nr:Transcription factor floricaula/leafy - FL [Saccharum hybrid cultivar R570]AOZ57131.1 Transcription factor floricaula/leafy - FL [Saccharum hybrid cultivar R570]